MQNRYKKNIETIAKSIKEKHKKQFSYLNIISLLEYINIKRLKK
jgi:hypothetical protein